jgi:Zinc finger, C3HC4 type (RING finger)
VLAASAALAHALRRSPADAQRRRLLRRLDRVAPRRSYSSARDRGLLALNAACPVCLAEFAAAPDRTLRVQNECRHALCAECLETWVLHTTKAHLNPARFGLTRGGDIVSWHCPPNCPLCRNKIPVISDADIREAIIAAVTHQGGALSTFTSSAPQFHGFPPSIFLT